VEGGIIRSSSRGRIDWAARKGGEDVERQFSTEKIRKVEPLVRDKYDLSRGWGYHSKGVRTKGRLTWR